MNDRNKALKDAYLAFIDEPVMMSLTVSSYSQMIDEMYGHYFSNPVLATQWRLSRQYEDRLSDYWKARRIKLDRIGRKGQKKLVKKLCMNFEFRMSPLFQTDEQSGWMNFEFRMSPLFSPLFQTDEQSGWYYRTVETDE